MAHDGQAEEKPAARAGHKKCGFSAWWGPADVRASFPIRAEAIDPAAVRRMAELGSVAVQVAEKSLACRTLLLLPHVDKTKRFRHARLLLHLPVLLATDNRGLPSIFAGGFHAWEIGLLIN